MQVQFTINSRVALDDDISASGYEAQTNWSKIQKGAPSGITKQYKSVACDISSMC